MTFILSILAVGIIFWYICGEIGDIAGGDSDTFLGKMLGYFIIFAVISAIIG